MSQRSLDALLSADLASGTIQPIWLAMLTFKSATVYVNSSPRTFSYNGQSYLGVGTFGSVGAIGEGSAVKADGTTVTLSGIPLSGAGGPGLLAESLADIQLGASARLWYGHLRLADGAMVGVPYLAFSGTVDKPTVHVGADTVSITLALENRLVNLQRANQRRYTAADQHLQYPDDTGFNSVEQLNDIALRWGN